MKRNLYVEVLPGEWPNWRPIPWRWNFGRVTKRQPKDGRHYVTIEVDVDMERHFGAARGVSVEVKS